MSKRIANTELVQSLVGQEPWKLNGREIRPGELLLSIIMGIHQVMNAQRAEVMTLVDAHHSSRVIERLLDPVIELEDADYEWLKTVALPYAPRMLGPNAQLAVRIVEGATDLVPKPSPDGSIEQPEEAVRQESANKG
jgi:hypothetical protein